MVSVNFVCRWLLKIVASSTQHLFDFFFFLVGFFLKLNKLPPHQKSFIFFPFFKVLDRPIQKFL